MAGRMSSRTGQETGSSSVGERIIRKNHSKLRRELNIPVLLPYLRKYHLITTDIQEELTLPTTTSTAKVDKLVAEVPRTGDNSLECFIKCLRESGVEEPGTSHNEIADVLEEDLKHQSTPGFVVTSHDPTTPEIATPENKENGHSYQPLKIGNSSVCEKVLRKYHFKLRKELNVQILLPYLNKYHLITADIHEELILQTTNATKVDRLVAELPRMGDNSLDRLIKCLRDSAEEEPGTCHGQIANDLEEELQHETTPESMDGCVDYPRNTQVAMAVMADVDPLREPLVHHERHYQRTEEGGLFIRGLDLKKICCNRWCCCYTTVFVIIALLTLILILFSQVPQVLPSVLPSNVYWNSTVELQFDQMSWLDHIDISFSKMTCSTPQGQLYVLRGQDCTELPKVTTNYVDPQSPVDGVYMRPGSTINFTVSAGSIGQVWIFSNYESKNDFDGTPTELIHAEFNCNSPPLGAYCFEAANYLNGSYLYTVTQPAFYWIRQSPASFNVTPNKRTFDHSYNRVLFDLEAIASSASITELSLDPTTVNVQKRFVPEKTCVLLDISENIFCFSRMELQASNATRRQDILLYPGIAVVICIAVLIVAITFHVYMYHRSRNQVSGNYIT